MRRSSTADLLKKSSNERKDDSQGRTVSKRKIRELVESVDPEEKLSDEVEEVRLLSPSLSFASEHLG